MELAAGQLHKTRAAPDYKSSMRLPDPRETTSPIRTPTQTWNTLLLLNGAGRRPAPQDKRSTRLEEKHEISKHAWDDQSNSDKNTDMAHAKRSTRLQEKHETTRHAREMTSLIRTRTHTWNTLLVKNESWPKASSTRQDKLQTTREGWDYKTRFVVFPLVVRVSVVSFFCLIVVLSLFDFIILGWYYVFTGFL